MKVAESVETCKAYRKLQEKKRFVKVVEAINGFDSFLKVEKPQ